MIRSNKGLKRLGRKAAREGRLGGHVKAGLKYLNAVMEMYSCIVWDGEEIYPERAEMTILGPDDPNQPLLGPIIEERRGPIVRLTVERDPEDSLPKEIPDGPKKACLW